MDKYQRALEALKVDRTWQKVADILTEGWRLSFIIDNNEVVWPSDAWSVWKGENKSVKVNTALETLGLVSMPGPRWRQHCEFPDEKTMKDFRDFYHIDAEYTFTDWVQAQWGKDIEQRLHVDDLIYVEGYR